MSRGRPADGAGTAEGEDADEAARLAALHRLEILDTEEEPAFTDIVKLAAYVCGTPIAAVSLIDTDRQWFKARLGLEVSQLPRRGAFCQRTMHGETLLVVDDTHADDDWSSNPFVVDDPNIRFYAGAPLRTDDGHPMGSLCVIDRVPNHLTTEQRSMLSALGRQVERLFSIRLQAREAERARIEMLRSEGRLRLILDSLTQGVVVHAPGGAIAEANPAAVEILGLSRDELLGRTPFDPRWGAVGRDGRPISGDEHPSAITLRDAVAVTNATVGIVRPDGTRRWLAVNSSPIESTEWTGTGAAITFSDVTDLLVLNDQLQESLTKLVRSSQERSSMLSAVSHDLRAPLAALRMMTEILEDRREAITEEQQRELVHRIRMEARRTEGVLADLVSADRISGGFGAPRRQRIDLEALVRRSVREASSDLHTLRLGALTGDLTLWADRAQLERIVDNLLGNALRHTPPRSTIVVEAHRRDDRIELIVEDDGKGVPDEMKALVFDAYVRGHDTNDRPGSGLGLFLVAQFADFHSGRAWCEDSALGGARFVVSFPTDEPTDDPSE